MIHIVQLALGIQPHKKPCKIFDNITKNKRFETDSVKKFLMNLLLIVTFLVNQTRKSSVYFGKFSVRNQTMLVLHIDSFQ